MTPVSPLTRLFAPRSVAVVGASGDYRKVGHLVAKNMLLQGFAGSLYLINARSNSVLGRTTYPSLESLPEVVDVAVFATPASVTLDEIENKSHLFSTAVILAAEFKENDSDESRAHEARLQKIISEGKTIFLGPNCAGFANPHVGVNATFLPGPVPKGNIAFVSQSGALGSVMIDYLSDRTDTGFSFFASLGNKSQLTESIALEYLIDDPTTEVVALYLEDVKQGDAFMTSLRRLAQKKPVIVYKSGSSVKGAQAAISHTGSLAGDDRVFSAVVHQSGAIRAESIDEFFTLLELYAHHMAPARNSFIVITNAGGGGVIAADAIEKHALTLSRWHLGVDDQKVIAHNPFDVRGDADAQKFVQALTETKDEKVGGVIVIVTPQANTQIEDTAKAIAGMSSALPHPIYPIFLGKWSQSQAMRIVQRSQLPCFSSVETLISALKKSVQRNHMIECLDTAPTVSTVVKTASAPPTTQARVLNLEESYKLLQTYGVPMLPFSMARSEHDLAALEHTLHFPVVAKISDASLTHKTEAGGLVLDVCTHAELTTLYQSFVARGYHEVLIQQQIRGLEFLLGAKRDVTFGPVLVFGMGGILTNHLHQTMQTVGLLPPAALQEVMSQSVVAPLLKGFRGFPAIDVTMLSGLMQKIQTMMQENAHIVEIDINPLIMSQAGLIQGVDARIVVRD